MESPAEYAWLDIGAQMKLSGLSVYSFLLFPSHMSKLLRVARRLKIHQLPILTSATEKRTFLLQ